MNRKDQIMRRQQELLTAARNEQRNLTEEEQAEFDNLQRELEALPDDSSSAGAQTSGQRDMGAGMDGKSTETPAQAAQRAVAQERQRIADITALCRNFGLSPDDFISRGYDMDRTGTAAAHRCTGQRACDSGRTGQVSRSGFGWTDAPGWGDGGTAGRGQYTV